MSPRVREDSVHPRLRLGASGRPLNLTVRRHMDPPQSFIAWVAVALIVLGLASYAIQNRAARGFAQFVLGPRGAHVRFWVVLVLYIGAWVGIAFFIWHVFAWRHAV